VVQQGRLYRIASVLSGTFGANEYVATDGSAVVVPGWWGPDLPGGGRHRLRLAGLKPGARYLDSATGRQHWGAELMQEGIAPPFDAGLDFGSVLIRLARVAPLFDVVHSVSTAGRPGANRTRIRGLGHHCPVPLDHGPFGDAPGDRTRPRRVCSPPPAPARRAPWCFRPESNRVTVLRRDGSKSVTGSGVRRGGLEPPCGMPGLQPSAVAAAPPTLGVTGGFRPLCGRVHGPAPRHSVRPPCSAKESDLRPPVVGRALCH
jgi:hypothetical protein